MVLLLLIVCEVALATSDYCQWTPRHTLCGYQGPGPACGSQLLGRGVTSEEREVILQTHNKVRARIASGRERRGRPGPQPPAANMKQMFWDPELARLAQAHADQCKFAHDCSECRRVERFAVGQNLFIYRQTVRLADIDWEKAVTDWYDEVELFSNRNVKPFKFSVEYGHYTALAWADTDRVGCGASSYRQGKWLTTLYTCNYGPAGNFINGEMYLSGPACSSCQPGSVCSQQYPGLCVSPSGLNSTLTPATTPVTTTSTTTTRAPTTRTTRTPTTALTTTTVRSIPSGRRPAPVTSRPGAVPSLAPSTGLLRTCDFEEVGEKSCEVRGSGVGWQRERDGEGNAFYSTQLLYRDKTDLILADLFPPPSTSGVICVTFKYKKYSLAGHKSSLAVLVWPYKEKPGKISVFRDSPGVSRWMSASITFRNVENSFILLFRGGGPATKADYLYLAVDDVKVEEGKCGA